MIVTLLTDFGTADYFVGAMKGAILSVNARAQLVDLTHEVPAYDIEAGAFTLVAAYATFPAGTTHLAVVDPGVGSARRPVLVAGGGHFFVGPDNGLFGLVYERLKEFRVIHLTRERYFRPEVSSTFHGRDLFAPVAGAVSSGVPPEELGEVVTDFVRLGRAAPRRLPDSSVEGTVLHVDRFGNCVTNLTPREFDAGELGAGARLSVGEREVGAFRRFFAEDADRPGEPFAVWGSAGFLEIAVYLGSAARTLGVERGARVLLRR